MPAARRGCNAPVIINSSIEDRRANNFRLVKEVWNLPVDRASLVVGSGNLEGELHRQDNSLRSDIFDNAGD
jgi:hypothetical protein